MAPTPLAICTAPMQGAALAGMMYVEQHADGTLTIGDAWKATVERCIPLGFLTISLIDVEGYTGVSRAILPRPGSTFRVVGKPRSQALQQSTSNETLHLRRLAGCVTQRRSRRSGTIVSIYAAVQAGLDASTGAWVTLCEEHHTLAAHRTLALAHHLPAVEWCEACQLQLRQS